MNTWWFGLLLLPLVVQGAEPTVALERDPPGAAENHGASGGGSRSGASLAEATPFSPARLRQLVADLGSSKFAVREQATRDLMASGDQAAPYLDAAVNSDDPEVRLRARQIMARLGLGAVETVEPAALAEVNALLEPVTSATHPNLGAIVKLGRRATPPLVLISKQGHDRKSVYAMIALTRLGDPRSFAALAGLFQDPTLAPHLRDYVAAIKDPRLLFHLIKAWQDAGAAASPELRSQVALMSGQKLGDDPRAWMKWFLATYGDKL